MGVQAGSIGPSASVACTAAPSSASHPASLVSQKLPRNHPVRPQGWRGGGSLSVRSGIPGGDPSVSGGDPQLVRSGRQGCPQAWHSCPGAGEQAEPATRPSPRSLQPLGEVRMLRCDCSSLSKHSRKLLEGRRRRGRQGMRWLDGITDSMDVSLGELREMVWKGRPGAL